MRKILLFAVGLLACSPVGLFAQALPSLSSLQVRYSAARNAAKPDGELKAQLDEVEKTLGEARRAGNSSEMRRQLAKGMALLDKQAWISATRLPRIIGAAQRALEDGAMTIQAEVFDGTNSLGASTLGVFLNKGLDGRLSALESASKTVTSAVRDDVLFPGDYIKNVNRGRIELADFNVGVEVTKAEAIVTGAKGGKDPFKTKTGDFERHYLLQGANEIMPYRVYVPKGYAATKATPLVIALHGLGANEDSMFDNYEQLLPQLSEKHGFLLAAPLGFRRDGFYGSGVMGATDAASRQRGEYSEKDVLEVLRLMKAAYNVDESRIYLIGHSMGAIGTWAIASKYPQTWAALVAFSGVGSPSLADNMKAIPHFVVHGDADSTVNVSGSRNMVAALKKLNANVTYIEVPGGGHSDVVAPNMTKAFEFLAAQKKQVAGSK